MKTYCVFCEVVTVLSYADVLRLTHFPGTQFQARTFKESKKKKKTCENCAEIFVT